MAVADGEQPQSLQERRRHLETLKYRHSLRAGAEPHLSVDGTACDDEHSAPKLATDATLTAFAQLATLRMNAKRAFVCLVDSVQLHVLAEATQSISPFNASNYAPGDSILLGVQSIQHDDTITAWTLPAYDGHHDYFLESETSIVNASKCVITDLHAEPRFKDMQFTKQNQQSRFYAETPIRLSSGLAIGIVGVLDDQPRSDPASIDIGPLQDVARLAVEHIELIRLRNISVRAERLMLGLGRFNSGYSSIEQRSDNQNQPVVVVASPNVDQELRTASSHNPRAMLERLPSFPPFDQVGTSTSSGPQSPVVDRNQTQSGMAQSLDRIASPSSATESSTIDLPSDVKHVFTRASNILLESMELDACCFLELPAKNFSGTDTQRDMEESPQTRSASTNRRARSSDSSDSSISPANHCEPSNTIPVIDHPQEKTPRNKRKGVLCKKLSASTRENQDQMASNSQPSRFALSQKALRQLVSLYPAGHIFNFDNHSAVPSGDESGISSRLPNTWWKITSMIARVFPDATSLAFVPLYDDRQTPYAGFFGWTTDPFRVLGPDESIFISGFANSMMCEISRLEALALDKVKSDFMSSISHELRSPLHGILAATQLIQESHLSSDQQELAIMVDGCSRTLLDIMSNLLEHSRINNLIDQKRSSKRSKTNRSTERISRGSLNTEQSRISDAALPFIDIATVLEQVISSTHTGTIIQDKGEAYASTNKHPRAQKALADVSKANGDLPDQIPYRPIVVVDIECRDSWYCQIDVGSWRRVLMNLIGNALKYTEKGYVYVALNTEADIGAGLNDKHTQVTLTVSDTGRGMSENYMTHSLYTPFSQEDNLSVGVGLGLSIVDRLVASMSGKIRIKSKPDVGTNVLVTVPLQMKPPTNEANVLSATTIDPLKQAAQTIKSVCFIGFGEETTPGSDSTSTEDVYSKGLMMLKKSLSNYVQRWLNIGLTTNSSEATIVIIDEFYALSLIRRDPSSTMFTKPYILFTASGQALSTDIHWMGCYSRMTTPTGPEKLVRTFANLLRQQENSNYDSPNKAHRRNHSATQKRMSDAQETAPTHDRTQVDETSPDSDSEPSTPPTEYRLLLVEDNDVNLRILTKLVGKLKFPFITATNGKEALDHYINSYEEGHPIRCVFMDISMPVMDGLESTRRIRAYEKQKQVSEPAEIIALTGLGLMETQDEAMASGVDLYHRKPVNLDVLRKMLSNRGQREAMNQ